jgi:hypothetical protein
MPSKHTKQPTQRRTLHRLLQLVRHSGSSLGEALAEAVLRQTIDEHAFTFTFTPGLGDSTAATWLAISRRQRRGSAGYG